MVDYSGSYATPRADLGQAFMEFVEDPKMWVTPRVLPRLEVSAKTAKFSAFTRAGLLRNDVGKRSPRGKYNRISADAADHVYNTEHFGWEFPIDDVERERFASDFDAELMATRALHFRIKIAQEIRTAAACFNTTTFTSGNTCFTDKSVTDPWTDPSSDIYKAVQDAREAVRKRTGLEANKALISKANWLNLKYNTDLSKSRRNVTVRLTDEEIRDSLAEQLGLDEIVIAKGVYNSASESKTETMTDIFSPKFCLVFYSAPDGAPLEQPSLGRSIYFDMIGEELITMYREEKIRSDVVRIEQFCQEYIYGPDVNSGAPAFGQLIQTAP